MNNRTNKLKMLLLVFFSMASYAFAANTVGTLTIDKDSALEINHNGLAKILNSKLTKQIKINGSLSAVNVQFENTLDVNGKLILNQVKGASDIHVVGVAKINQSDFKGNLIIRSDRGSVLADVNVLGVVDFSGSVLDINGHSNITKILVRPSLEHPELPVVKLKSDVPLSMTIEFEGTQGKILVGENTIFKGKVINGTLEINSSK